MEECIICFEEVTNFVIFPCHHKVCVICYPKLKRCPMCNSEFAEVIQPDYTNAKIACIKILFCMILIVLLFLSFKRYY